MSLKKCSLGTQPIQTNFVFADRFMASKQHKTGKPDPGNCFLTSVPIVRLGCVFYMNSSLQSKSTVCMCGISKYSDPFSFSSFCSIKTFFKKSKAFTVLQIYNKKKSYQLKITITFAQVFRPFNQ